jgi:hypothetical protein
VSLYPAIKQSKEKQENDQRKTTTTTTTTTQNISQKHTWNIPSGFLSHASSSRFLCLSSIDGFFYLSGCRTLWLCPPRYAGKEAFFKRSFSL